MKTGATLPAMPKITILGIDASGAASLTAAQKRYVWAADLLVGGTRHLAYFPDFTGKTLAIKADMAGVAETIQTAQRNGERVTVLASGDPYCYGIGSTLRRWIDADDLHVMPAPSAYQLAFAALNEPWQNAALLTAHGRALPSVIRDVLTNKTSAILTDQHNTPAAIAKALLALELDGETACAVCENLGAAEQRVVRLSLLEMAQQTFAALNVTLVFNQQPLQACPPGLPDSAFTTENKQITKREVRLLALAELELQQANVLWDIGAGSGSIGIEAARAFPGLQVYAVEKREKLLAHLQHNRQVHHAPLLTATLGFAPAACADWPQPDAIFIGGSGGNLADIIHMAQERLTVGGRLVAAFATYENFNQFSALLPEATASLINISVSKPVQALTRFAAHNPVFLAKWIKPNAL